MERAGLGCSPVLVVGYSPSFGFAAAWDGWGSGFLPVPVAVQSLGGMAGALSLPGPIVGWVGCISLGTLAHPGYGVA